MSIMKLRCLAVLVAGSLVQGQADPAGHEFIAAGPDDSRSPCPAMNALANHGFLPRNGLAVTQAILEQGFLDAMNFQPGSLAGVTNATISTGARNDGSFDLAESVLHNVVEHDASLSRGDAALGDALHFNPAIWNVTLKHFLQATISIDDAVRARLDRVAAASAINTVFNLTDAGSMGSFGEAALYLIVFGDRAPTLEGNANTQFLRVMFEEERLPYREGYNKSEPQINLDEIVAMISKLQEATVNSGT